MRGVILAAAVLLCARLVPAQEQERRLLDRLLKPDMSLQNDAQKKQFTASGATVEKNTRTKSFYFQERKREKGFWNTRQIASREFSTGRSRFSDAKANLATRSRLAKIDQSYAVGGYRDVRPARDASKTISTSNFVGNRAFLVQGKSQKFLHAQDRPLTIDQVRELLNKNK